MIKRAPIRRPAEDGYMLVAIIFMMAILVLSMAVAIPRIKDEIQRDRDVETVQRGKQYIRAIKLYYKKFHAYPPNVDALEKTNDIRFLRKKYIDPTTGKEEWKPVLFGQNKVPIAYGFFGQPIGGTTIAGTGPSGGNGLGNGMGNGLSGTSGTGSSSFGFSLGSSSSTTDPNAPASGQPGSNPSAFGGAGSGPGTGAGGQTFGGAGIIGFSPGSPKQSILVYKKKNHYNEWEFTYDPLADQMQTLGGAGNGLNGQPANGTSNPAGGGFGSTSPTTTTPTTTTTTPPSQ
jgi:type II secretory pathway pseudopilin PulG